MIDKKRLQEKAIADGIILDSDQLDALACYAHMLLEWNQKMNLTAITEPEDIENKHFLDALHFAAQAEVAGNLVDVGTGAGFPGIVAKIYKPEIALTLMEPTGKRLQFLQHVCGRLGLEATFLKERAEEAGRKRWRAQYDVSTARAVAPMPVLCEYCLPLVKLSGYFVAMKADVTNELDTAENAIRKLGGAAPELRRYALPDGSARVLVMIRKVEDTPAQYPRNGGTIAKRPL
ncbi:MAG: 16S rRNA (guanine(527)-N(7))-methyltransferase RsmG [Ruminococcaceae bacterium]|nr:16S rRNA (guanine(527)-N(7))-methyltransferase RsmG [Oscillospiraceae bacterium]